MLSYFIGSIFLSGPCKPLSEEFFSQGKAGFMEMSLWGKRGTGPRKFWNNCISTYLLKGKRKAIALIGFGGSHIF
jgi:hypothetical protein